MSDLERPNKTTFTENNFLPTLEKAQADKEKFFELVKEIEESTAAGPVDPQIRNQVRTLVALGDEYANIILQHAGKIPENDPRHKIFECYNAILAKWKQLSFVKK